MTVRTKQDAARVLADVSGDKRFFCCDGCIIENLTGLMSCLSHMTQDIFENHVTEEKNDFGNWVRDIMGDDKLARDLGSVTTPVEAVKVIEERVAWLQKKISDGKIRN